MPGNNKWCGIFCVYWKLLWTLYHKHDVLWFQEGKALLAGEKLADTRQETAAQKGRKAPLKKNSTIAKTIKEGNWVVQYVLLKLLWWQVFGLISALCSQMTAKNKTDAVQLSFNGLKNMEAPRKKTMQYRVIWKTKHMQCWFLSRVSLQEKKNCNTGWFESFH